MKKWLVLLFCIFFYNFSLAENFEKIIINGNKRISDDTIIVLGNIKINESYDDTKLNFILKELYSTTFFKDIKIYIEKNILFIDVVENPIIENIEIIGLEKSKILDNILNVISSKKNMSFDDNKLMKDITLIKNIFKSNGYYFVKIDTSKVINNQLNSVSLKLNIDKGNRSKINKISFLGEKKIKDKQLLEIIVSEEHKFWKFISNNIYLNQNNINLDKRLLENYYKNLGYYKVKIEDSFAVADTNGNINLIFNINSGDQFYFNDLKLNLPDDYDENDFIEINKIFEKLKGKKYSITDFNSILSKIDNIASARLYDFIDAKVQETVVGNNLLNFEFYVYDDKKLYVERVNIFGNYQTLEEVIRNKLIVDEGDPLNNLLLNKSIDKIKGLRIFKSVESEIVDAEDPNYKIINLTVEEQATGEISMGAGVGTGGSTLAAGIVEKNFLGKGINLNTNIEISEDGLKGNFTYSRPNFAYTDNTLSTSLEANTLDFLSDYGYKISKNGFSLGTTFEQYENLFFSPEISISIEDLETNSNASTQLKKQEGTYEDIYLNYSLNYDLRDSSYNPSAGNSTFFNQEIPVVSDNNELSNTIIFNQYKTLNQASRTIGKASLYLKTVNSINNSDVRISKRGQVPYNRLRGFQRGKIGPIDNGDFIGGNYVGALNLSTNLPGLLKTVENIDFTYFIDIANVWGVDYDQSIDESNSIRSSTGIGMNLLSPIGPLNFSLTQPITKKTTDKVETFRFNLGTTF